MVQRSMLENIMRIDMEQKALQEKRRRVRVGMKVQAVVMCMDGCTCVQDAGSMYTSKHTLRPCGHAGEGAVLRG